MTTGSSMSIVRFLSRSSLTRLPSAAWSSFEASTGCRDFRFPAQFAKELERIEMLHDPERTAALEALNDEMFRSLTRTSVRSGRPRISEDDALRPASPREQIRELLSHLAQNNPYFALWVAYKKG